MPQTFPCIMEPVKMIKILLITFPPLPGPVLRTSGLESHGGNQSCVKHDYGARQAIDPVKNHSTRATGEITVIGKMLIYPGAGSVLMVCYSKLPVATPENLWGLLKNISSAMVLGGSETIPWSKAFLLRACSWGDVSSSNLYSLKMMVQA